MTKTFLAQNKFINSADAAECEAVVNASPPSTATANPIEACCSQGNMAADSAPCDLLVGLSGVPAQERPLTLSGGVGAKPILASSPSEAATVSGRAPVAATLQHNQVTQAVEVRTSLEDELTHLIGVAGKRRRRPLALPPFAPDFPALWKAMHDKTAPRVVLDPLWADASPLFLRDAS